jgi:hypothetical protein
MVKLSVYVPESHLEIVKRAMFGAGAGRMGHYEECCWHTLGEGQFRPAPGSKPFIGSTGNLSVVPEYQLEMVCQKELLLAVITAMKRVHPYEEPAYAAWQLLGI